jgi:hypothetical protein
LFLEQELSKKYYYIIKMYITISTTFQYQEKPRSSEEGRHGGRKRRRHGERIEKGRHEGSKAWRKGGKKGEKKGEK